MTGTGKPSVPPLHHMHERQYIFAIKILSIYHKNLTSYLFSSIFFYEFDEIKENVVFSLMTCNTTLYLYSPMTLSYYMYLYCNFSFSCCYSKLRSKTFSSFFITLFHVLFDIELMYYVQYHALAGPLTGHSSRLSHRFRPCRTRSFPQISYHTA